MTTAAEKTLDHPDPTEPDIDILLQHEMYGWLENVAWLSHRVVHDEL